MACCHKLSAALCLCTLLHLYCHYVEHTNAMASVTAVWCWTCPRCCPVTPCSYQPLSFWLDPAARCSTKQHPWLNPAINTQLYDTDNIVRDGIIWEGESLSLVCWMV
jgi:hypothetical protein